MVEAACMALRHLAHQPSTLRALRRRRGSVLGPLLARAEAVTEPGRPPEDGTDMRAGMFAMDFVATMCAVDTRVAKKTPDWAFPSVACMMFDMRDSHGARVFLHTAAKALAALLSRRATRAAAVAAAAESGGARRGGGGAAGGLAACLAREDSDVAGWAALALARLLAACPRSEAARPGVCGFGFRKARARPRVAAGSGRTCAPSAGCGRGRELWGLGRAGAVRC
jgi:hypothetical protein